MKITLSTNQVQDALYADKNAGWSWKGARALAEELEALEESTGEEMELDVVAIRCDYTEYPSGLEAATAYGYEQEEGEDREEDEEKAVDWLRERTSVIEFDGGVIVQQF